MKIIKNTDAIKPGKRYYLELEADEEKGFFCLSPYGRLRLNPSHIRRLYIVEPAIPAFPRCKDCEHAEAVDARNVRCKHNTKVEWSKMSKACEKFKEKQS